MKIFKWDSFNDIIENRIEKIDINEFNSMVEKCYKWKTNVLYKQIYNPDFEIGLFKKSLKMNESLIDNNINIDDTYPNKNYSLVCTTENINNNDIPVFVVLPFKESLFTIEEKNGYYKGYWKDKIKWLEKHNSNKLWTDSDCLLIRKDIWDNYLKENKDKKEYTSRDVLATTLIGETGGDRKDAPMVLSVLKNRAKKRGTEPYEEALRKYQFSMWNKHYNKGTPIKDIIKYYKNSSKWKESDWEYVYSLVDKIDSLPDKVGGSTMYYAHKKVLPYWADNESEKMKEFGKMWKEKTKSHLHTYGVIV